MKKTLFLTIVFLLFSVNYTSAQLSKFVKNVSKSVEKDLFGNKSGNAKTIPEPLCACSDATLIVDIGGNFKVDYSEISITTSDDGSVLIQNKNTGDYSIAKDGVIKGSYSKEDPAITEFGITPDGTTDFLVRYKEYISKSDGKYLITFMGKTYGPYARLDNLIVTKSKDKFAAMVVEKEMVTEEQAKKFEAAVKNAKTDEEKMNLSMQYAQMVQSNMGNSGASAVTPKFITNIQGTTYDPMEKIGAQLAGNCKYDEILLIAYDKILDLKGKTIFNIGMNSLNANAFFINSDNTRYASYSYGTLTFNDKSTLVEIFNPHWLKEDGKVYLAYMYYSPKKNAIMQCKIPF
jgi:hypothetical protein